MKYQEISNCFTYKYAYCQTEKDNLILHKVEEHLAEVIDNGYFDLKSIFFIALEGSQNYELDLPNSDIDTKLIVLPNFEDFVLNNKPVSTTHIRKNGEHISFTDVRNYFSSLRKQNINFVETLFSPWIIVNKIYEEEFKALYKNRELIARYNPVKAVKTIGGIATDRYKAIYNLNSKRVDVIKQYGYDGKAISHLCRLTQFLYDYTSECKYRVCMVPLYKQLILDLKQNKINPARAKNIAEAEYETIQRIVDNYTKQHEETINEEAENLLTYLQFSLVQASFLADCAAQG